MTQVNVYDLTGQKVSTQELPESIFAKPASPALLAQAVRVYLSNQRQNTKAVKTRGQVSYSTHKIWKQKGTGHARHGSRRAPIFVGGGVAHGPSGEENYNLKMSQKMRRVALLGALTAQAENISLIKDLAECDGKTKNLKATLAKIVGENTKTLLILESPLPKVLQAVKNLNWVSPTQTQRLNTYEVLNHRHLVISVAALGRLAQPEEV